MRAWPQPELIPKKAWSKVWVGFTTNGFPHERPIHRLDACSDYGRNWDSSGTHVSRNTEARTSQGTTLVSRRIATCSRKRDYEASDETSREQPFLSRQTTCRECWRNTRTAGPVGGWKHRPVLGCEPDWPVRDGRAFPRPLSTTKCRFQRTVHYRSTFNAPVRCSRARRFRYG